MDSEFLLDNFGVIAGAPGAVTRLRGFILDSAIRGRLTSQIAEEQPAADALYVVRSDKDTTLRGSIRGGEAVARVPSNEGLAESLPRGWALARLDDTGQYVNGLGFRNTDWRATGIPIIRIQNLTSPALPFNHADGPFPEDRLARQGDILVSWSATLDAFRWSGPEAVVNQHIFKVIPDTRVVTTDFLFHLLRHSIARLAQTDVAHGLTMKHINRGPFLSFVVGIPPLAEQVRIVEKLDDLLSRCDELAEAASARARAGSAWRASALDDLAAASSPADVVERWERVSACWELVGDDMDGLSDLRQSILQLAVQGRLTPQDGGETPATELVQEIAEVRLAKSGVGRRRREVADSFQPLLDQSLVPPGWTEVTLDEIADVIRGITFPAAAKHATGGDGRIACLRTSNVQDSIEWSDLIYVAETHVKNQDQMVREGDIIISMANSRELVGKVALVEGPLLEPAAIGGFVAAIRAVVVEPRFLLAVLRDPRSKARLVKSATQTTNIANISLGRLRPFRLALPPLAEQRRIVEVLDELNKASGLLESALARRMREHELLARSLMRAS